MTEQLRVAIDVGCALHRVAVGMPDGRVLDEFDVSHSAARARGQVRQSDNPELLHPLGHASGTSPSFQCPRLRDTAAILILPASVVRQNWGQCQHSYTSSTV